MARRPERRSRRELHMKGKVLILQLPIGGPGVAEIAGLALPT
jgi:hypothetical protein